VSTRDGEQVVHVRAPGKINLALRVGPAGPDGYHRLVTVFQAVSLYEDVRAEAATQISVTVSGRQAGAVPTGERNLAVRAARLLADSAGVSSGVHLHLTKGVPTAGGMGGGSADAAATLLACDVLWGTGLARDELAELAAELGADVPFALTGLTAVGTGRGDVLSPVLGRGTFHWVLALQDAGLSTPSVFARFDGLQAGPVAEPEMSHDLMVALRAGDAAALAPHLVNDLQPAAVDLAPLVGEVLAAAAEAGALAEIVSGSGPTVVALAANHGHAQDLATRLRAADVADEVLVVSGPVPGARVLESMRAGGAAGPG
jgi:4-diphosphocytidyl-2-C-methyl-D-erythritol kinase